MITLRQNRRVLRWLRLNARNKVVAPEIWGVILENMDKTGVLKLRQKAIADEVGCDHTEVSRTMSQLVEAKALERTREQGIIVWRINPKVASQLSNEARKAAQEGKPEVPMLPLPKRAPPIEPQAAA